jgi:excisionase family DNA binding protein
MERKAYSTEEAAEQIGVSRQTLFTWIGKGFIAIPKAMAVGKTLIRLWTKTDIERARKFKGTLKRGPKAKE